MYGDFFPLIIPSLVCYFLKFLYSHFNIYAIFMYIRFLSVLKGFTSKFLLILIKFFLKKLFSNPYYLHIRPDTFKNYLITFGVY